MRQSINGIRILEMDPIQKSGLEKVVGKSDTIRQVLEQAIQAASTDVSVYIEGESGTGKELIARLVHGASLRKNNRFVVINCASVPEGLCESELFGFEKGAFTGAEHKKMGLFAQSDRGSFFLDEISEMPLIMQTKILRLLQEKEFYPLGGTRPVTVDTRVISTSNRNLKSEMEKGNFREDLFYRIHVFVIKLPPLRERKEDIPLLADFFLKTFSIKNDKNIKGFSTGAMHKMRLYHWPGNIRELKNEVESAAAMTRKDIITEECILRTQNDKIIPFKPFKTAKADFEKKYLLRLMDYTNGNMTRAADLSGKYRADLYQLFKKHGLNPSAHRKKQG
jgi:two-component system, NtrC family, response regulator GlrR